MQLSVSLNQNACDLTDTVYLGNDTQVCSNDVQLQLFVLDADTARITIE